MSDYPYISPLPLPDGDSLIFENQSLILHFAGPRTVLSTGPNNGGFRRDLTSVFNHDGNPADGSPCVLLAETYEKHMDLEAERLGLNPSKTSGLLTTARMENAAIEQLEYEDFTVTAIVTGGIDKNGGRAGDPAVWHERDGIARSALGEVNASLGGTINILLHISANLTDDTLARALVTCTEAKTAAIQELLSPSFYSEGLATGSGTDGVIIICNPESPVLLTNAGKHCKLGEYIGKVVKKAVKMALERETDLNREFQHNVFRRMDRFGVTEEVFQNTFHKDPVQLEQTPELVTLTSLYAHLLDQLNWEMLSLAEVKDGAELLLREMKMPWQLGKFETKEELKKRMVKKYMEGLAEIIF